MAWCHKCHYGSNAYDPDPAIPCPQCGSTDEPEEKSPFPKTPQGMGSGKTKVKYVVEPKTKEEKLEESE